MIEEVKNWFKQAERDLDTANYLFDGERYEDACLFCQQSVEKALKTILIRNGRNIIKTHDLLFLANKVNLPPELKEGCKELTIIYTKTRYPDTPEMTKKLERAEEFISLAKRILEWTKEQL